MKMLLVIYLAFAAGSLSGYTLTDSDDAAQGVIARIIMAAIWPVVLILIGIGIVHKGSKAMHEWLKE